MNTLYEHAKAYVERGWSVIPVGDNKKPMINWKEFQERRATDQELEKWFSDPHVKGIGIVTGMISNLAVVDVDKKSGGMESIKKFHTPPTVIVRTGGGGFHYYFKYPSGARIKTAAGEIAAGIDVRGEGGYVVAPPSTHLSGNKYEWATAPDDAELADLPEWVIKNQQNTQKKDFVEIAKGVPEGMRNYSSTQMIGKLLQQKRSAKDLPWLWEVVRAWNERNQNPLPEKELRATFDGITRKEFSKSETGSAKMLFDSPLNLSDLLTGDTTVEWIVDQLLATGSITILSGDPSSFKTWITLHLALCVATGIPLFGEFKCIQKRVLVLNEEDSKSRIGHRLKQLGVEGNPPIFFHICSGFRVDNEKHIESIISLIEREDIGFIIIDSLRRVLTGDENESTAINNAIQLLRKLSIKDVTILITHHHGKKHEQSCGRHSMRGSSDILAGIDSHYMVKPVREKRLQFTQNKQRDNQGLGQFEVDILEVDDKIFFEYTGNASAPQRQKSKIEIAKEQILLMLEDQSGIDRKTLYSGINDVGNNNINEALKELEQEKRILVKKVHRRKELYSLPEKAINQNTSDTSSEDTCSQEDASGLQ